jgi:hypothetical protein
MNNNNGANPATFSAVSGNVTLGNANGKNDLQNVPINVTALGDVVINGFRSDMFVGNITTNGKLTLDTSLSGFVTGITAPAAGLGGSGFYSSTAATATPLAVGLSAPSTAGGVTATATATVDSTGAITGVTITNAGSGYTAAPTVVSIGGVAVAGGTVTPAATTAAVAGVATITAGGQLATVPVTTAGAKYATAPTVTITPVAGNFPTTAATAKAILDPVTGAVTGISITNPGIGYTAAPTVAIAAPTATSAVTVANFTPAVAGGNAKITENTGTKIFDYGTLTLKTTNGAVTLTNSGNNFGGYVVSTGTADIAITESSTVNLKSIATTGNLTVVSENGNIIEGADSTVTSNFLNVGGATGLTASKGSITLGLTNNTMTGGTGLVSSGDSLVLVTNGNLSLLTGTRVGGALTARDTAAYVAGTAGTIQQQTGGISVYGNVWFDAGTTGSINMTDPANTFGGIRFNAGASSAKITELTTMNIMGGSVSTVPVSLSTGGNFITSGPGGSSILGDLTINATGTITPGVGSLLVTGNFLVISNATKDLSALSKSGNLVNKDPINLGTGSYIAPGL